MSSLMRVSSFCGQQHREPIPVQLALLRDNLAHKNIDCNAAQTSLDLFRLLSVKEGSLVSIRTKQHAEVVLKLFLLDNDDNDNDKNLDYTTAAGNNQHCTLWIHPITAINLGLHNWGVLTDDSSDPMESVVIKPFPSEGSTMTAKKVTLRQWGRAPNHMPLLKTTKVKGEEGLQWPRNNSLLQLNKLISVPEHASGADTIYYYQVVEVDDDTRFAQRNDNSNATIHLPIYVSTSSTQYRLETLHRPPMCPKLPPQPPPSLSHQNMSELAKAMLLPPIAPASHRVLVTIAKQEDHDTRGAIRSAAAVVGRSCLTVDGLAAYSYRCTGKLVRGASLIDKLNGLKSAFDHAYRAAPCVLLVENIDLEFTSWNLDSRLREDEESRFWSCLVSELGGVDDNSTRPSLSQEVRCVTVPSVIVILAMTAPPLRGALSENIIWQPISLSFPDSEHVKYLWTKAEGPSISQASYALLKGRGASDISRMAEDLSDRLASTEASSSEIEKQQCADMLLRAWLDESRNDQQESSASDGIIPQVCWGDVGGLDHVRKEIMETIELPLKHSHLFPSHGRSGILLYGPPGTGKTLVAKAVANECGLPFLSVKGPELLGSYVGESEANVRAVFAKARSLASRNLPKAASIVFFDELDSLAPRRSEQQGSGGAGVMDRVVATFFAELDVEKDGLSVFCIGATNRPDILDPNLLRPGRLDRAVYLGLTELDRAKILEVHLSKLKLENGTTAKDTASMALRHLDRNFSGADLATVASNALMQATARLCEKAEREVEQRQQRERPDSPKTLDQVLLSWEPSSLVPIVELDDVLESAKNVVPSVDETQLAQYEKLRNDMERKE